MKGDRASKMVKGVYRKLDTNTAVGQIRHSRLGGCTLLKQEVHTFTHAHAQTHPEHLKDNGIMSGNPQTNMVIKSSPCPGAYKMGDNGSKRRGKILISALCAYYRLHSHTWALFAVCVCVFACSLIWVCLCMGACDCVFSCTQLCCISTTALYVLECVTAHGIDGLLVHLFLHRFVFGNYCTDYRVHIFHYVSACACL